MKRGTFKQKTHAEKLTSLREKQAKRGKVPKQEKKPAKRQISGNKRKPKTQSQLKKELDRVFSIYIRQKYADDNGMVACYTCGKVMHWKKIQNGHFLSRQYLATRWDENNCRPQCVGCNIYGNGKPLDFEERLKKELGDDFVEKMKLSRHQSLKLNQAWYLEQIKKYKTLCK